MQIKPHIKRFYDPVVGWCWGIYESREAKGPPPVIAMQFKLVKEMRPFRAGSR